MPYDALARRNGKPIGPMDGHRPMSSASSARSSSAGAYNRARVGPQVAGRGARPVANRPVAVGRPASNSRPVGGQQQQVQDLGRQLNEAKAMIETAEKERDFYFLKLREIEVYLQSTEFAQGSELEAMAKHIQGILYSTDEGEAENADAGHMDDQEYDQVSGHMNTLHVDEEETF
ncbi:microtubule integrity protein mal3 [Coemansia sp. RSA 485]|nr:microtubule integrity protein mal3 [Coemansia sp. RSA 485]